MTESTLNLTTAELRLSRMAGLRTFTAQLNSVQRSFMLGVVFALIYLSTHSGGYVPTSDGAYYLCVARNLYDGHGFTFNGQPVGIIPPGWPMLLAGAMHISRSFFFLGLIPIACLSSAISIWYLVICRAADSNKALLAMFVCGLLHPWYDPAHNFFSEAPFLLCLGGAVLLAQQIAAGASWITRLIPLLLLTALMVCFRWVGLASWAMIAAAALGGSLKFRLKQKCTLVLLIVVTVFGTFRLCAEYTSSPAHLSSYQDSVADLDSANRVDGAKLSSANSTSTTPSSKNVSSFPQPQNDEKALTVVKSPNTKSKSKAATIPQTQPIAISKSGNLMLVPSRMMHAGEWLTCLLCAPAELAEVSLLLRSLSNAFGWFLWLSYCIWAIHRARQRDWLWLGAVLYCTVIILRWGHVVPRYMLPAAPLLVIGIWNGIELIGNKFPRVHGAFLARALLVAIVIANCLMLGTDIVIARSDSFGENYYAGYSMKLVQASEYLREQKVSPGEVALSARYFNLNLDRPNSYAERQLNLLIGRAMQQAPAKLCKSVPDKNLIRWAKRNNVHYYIYRTPVSPWRVWHFRMPKLQAWITGKTVEEQPDWILYDLRDGKATRVTLPTHVAWPTTVPETVFR